MRLGCERRALRIAKFTIETGLSAGTPDPLTRRPNNGEITASSQAAGYRNSFCVTKNTPG